MGEIARQPLVIGKVLPLSPLVFCLHSLQEKLSLSQGSARSIGPVMILLIQPSILLFRPPENPENCSSFAHAPINLQVCSCNCSPSR